MRYDRKEESLGLVYMAATRRRVQNQSLSDSSELIAPSERPVELGDRDQGRLLVNARSSRRRADDVELRAASRGT